MTLDPFGDYQAAGYLRNTLRLPLGLELKKHEHRIFLNQKGAAADRLAKTKNIDYGSLLKTHEILFSRIYPWAGQDRRQTFPDKTIVKGAVTFAPPAEIFAAVSDAFRQAQREMARRPGRVIGLLAYAHPFLDGNGRTILTIANELAARADFSLDWRGMTKSDYLSALTKEIADPRDGALDEYLKFFKRPALTRLVVTEALGHISGLGS